MDKLKKIETQLDKMVRMQKQLEKKRKTREGSCQSEKRIRSQDA